MQYTEWIIRKSEKLFTFINSFAYKYLFLLFFHYSPFVFWWLHISGHIFLMISHITIKKHLILQK